MPVTTDGIPMRCALQDFKGQLHCERAFQILVILFGLIGFIVGYLQQDFRLTFYFLATGGGISAVVRAFRLPQDMLTSRASC